MSLKHLEFFNINSETVVHIKKMIKLQRVKVCKDELDKTFISETVENSDFGFIQATPIAILSTRRKSEKYLYSFLLGSHEDKPKSIQIKLLCSRNTLKKMGGELLNAAESYGREQNCELIRLFAIGEITLVKWYESQGYHVKTTILLPNGKVKVYEMIKLLKT